MLGKSTLPAQLHPQPLTYIDVGQGRTKQKTSIANNSKDHSVVKLRAGPALTIELPGPTMTQDRHLTTEVLSPGFISRKHEHTYHRALLFRHGAQNPMLPWEMDTVLKAVRVGGCSSLVSKTGALSPGCKDE